MKNLTLINNTWGDDKVIDACSIFGAMDASGRRFSGEGVIRAIANMHDRGNGLGGGFAVYGLYPEHAENYAFHLMYLRRPGQAGHRGLPAPLLRCRLAGGGPHPPHPGHQGPAARLALFRRRPGGAAGGPDARTTTSSPG